jgi:UDP-N-acetylmuramyl pentapeptide phosphotransferase/UDP-N-acetylglucosamine-1-phosphate transferase
VTPTAVGLGAVAMVIALQLLPGALRRAPHARPNYRGQIVLGTAGVALIVPLGIGAALALSVDEPASNVVLTMLCAGTAFAALGYVDDVYGSRRAGGFAGHARELLHGRVTTGAIKALGGGVVGLVAAWTSGRRGVWFIVGGVIVALSANLTNLLDVRPGRALKIWIPCAAALVITGMPGESEAVVAGLGGGAFGFLVHELREKVMLGDTGAGLLGGVLGIGAVAAFGPLALTILLGVLLALTIASEIVSFTRVIDSVPPLRWADRLGRAE